MCIFYNLIVFIGIKALDEYVNQTYSTSLSSFLFGEERSNIINQIRVAHKPDIEESEIDNPNADPTSQELWIVKDDAKNSRWEFICKPMYDVQVKNQKQRVVIKKM